MAGPGQVSVGSAASPWVTWLASGLLDAMRGAVVCTDLAGQIWYANARAEQLYGYSADQMLGRDVRDLLVGVADLPEAETIMAAVLAGAAWTGEFPVRTRDGSSVTVRLTDSPLWNEGQVVGVIGVADVLGVAETATKLAEARITRLALVTAELASCGDSDDVTAVVIAHAADAVGASVASLSLLTDADTLTLVGLRGGTQRAEDWSSYPLNANLPTSEALRELRAVVVGSRAEIEARYPALAGTVGADRAMVCLPLSVDGRRLGVISLGFPQQSVPDPEEMQFLSVFADTCAQALERLGALQEARTSAGRIGLLADVSIALAESLDYRTTLANVARLTVPTFADWCAVDILEDGVLTTLAVEHTDPDKIALANEYQHRYPARPEATSGPYGVIRSGRSELYPEITEEMLVSSARDEEHLRATRQLGLASVIIVPLVARGRTLGAITLISAESGRRFAGADLAFAENLARRAAAAIDNAQLFTQTQETAILLQRAILPTALPVVPGLTFASHYAPAGGTEVGGDFYDVIALPDGQVIAFLGDVAGRGVPAAAGMAQIRAAIRAYVAVDPDPVTVFTKLDGLTALAPVSDFVTVVYFVLDAQQETFSLISAGHPPPVLIDPLGQTSVLSTALGMPLGLGGERTASLHPLIPGGTVLLYSDGLVERRDEPIDQGIERLATISWRLAQGELGLHLSDLAFEQAVPDDDVTLLAIRRDPDRSH